jgi:hypothetical protein
MRRRNTPNQFVCQLAQVALYCAVQEMTVSLAKKIRDMMRHQPDH